MWGFLSFSWLLQVALKLETDFFLKIEYVRKLDGLWVNTTAEYRWPSLPKASHKVDSQWVCFDQLSCDHWREFISIPRVIFYNIGNVADHLGQEPTCDTNWAKTLSVRMLTLFLGGQLTASIAPYLVLNRKTALGESLRCLVFWCHGNDNRT